MGGSLQLLQVWLRLLAQERNPLLQCHICGE